MCWWFTKFISWVLVISILVIVAAAVIEVNYSTFCDSQIKKQSGRSPQFTQTGCLRCPTHGICSNGKLRCEDGFIVTGLRPKDYRCVMNSELAKTINAIEYQCKYTLAELNGIKECYDEDVTLHVPRTELERLASESLAKYFTRQQKDLFEDAFEHFVDDCRKKQVPGVKYNADTDKFHSTEVIKPYECIARETANRHAVELFVLSLLLIFIGVASFKVHRSRSFTKQVQTLSDQILHWLSENSTTGVIATDMRVKFNVRSDQVWDAVFTKVESNTGLKKYEHVNAGLQSHYWKWKAAFPYSTTT